MWYKTYQIYFQIEIGNNIHNYNLTIYLHYIFYLKEKEKVI